MIKMMKKLLISTLILFTLILSGCASSSNSSKEQEKKSAPAYSKSEKNNSRFDDWKYKGFGMELPEWVESAIDRKNEKTAKALKENPEDIIILTGQGINVDHSEEKLKPEIPQDALLLEGFWVRLNTELNKTDEPYITVLIYRKQSAITDIEAQEAKE